MNNFVLQRFIDNNPNIKIMKSICYHISIQMKSFLFGLMLFSSLFASSAFAQNLTIQSPNGGETWTYGANETATWTGENLSGIVTIEFSYDGGVNWWYLGQVPTGPNGGSTLLSPPNTSTTNAVLRILDYANPEVSDVSDAPFTVYIPAIFIWEPSGNSAVFANSLTQVYWILNISGITLINADISIDNGQTFTPLAQNINAYPTFTYLVLSDTPSDACVLKLYNAENPLQYGLSEVFSINPFPVYTITSPSGGEIVNTYSPLTLTWTVENPYSPANYIEFSSDNGESWEVIGNGSSQGNSGFFEWITPMVDSDECLLRITDAYAYSSFDISAAFTIMSYPETPVCMVTVDSLTNYNVVVWEKPVTDLIADFLVYKETDETYVYEVIDTVGYEEVPMVTDFDSNPEMRPYRYKIGFLDSENREFPASDYHQTIHLTINQGVNGNWNLIWTPYVGFEYASYYIVRKSGSGSYEDIATVSASFNSFTDFNAPDGDVSYMIKIVHPTGCDLTLRETGYPEVYSNAASNNVVNVSENEDFDFVVYPNPANDLINLVFGDKIKGQVNLIITDLAGRKIYSADFRNLNSGQMQSISSADFEEGMYLMHLQSGEKSNTMKIVVRH